MMIYFDLCLLHGVVGIEIEVIRRARERHIEQVKVIHPLRLCLRDICRLVVRAFHRLFPRHRHLLEPLHIALRLHTSLAP